MIRLYRRKGDRESDPYIKKELGKSDKIKEHVGRQLLNKGEYTFSVTFTCLLRDNELFYPGDTISVTDDFTQKMLYGVVTSVTLSGDIRRAVIDALLIVPDSFHSTS